MVRMVLFAASRDQLRYFSQIQERMGSEVSVWWYKTGNLPSFSVALPKAAIKKQVDILTVRKQNTRLGKSKSKFYWTLFRWNWTFQAYLLFYRYTGGIRRLSVGQVGVWNGKKIRQAILVLAAQKLNKQVIYFETGPLPGYSAVDPVGVDFYSALPREASFYARYRCNEANVLRLAQTEFIEGLPEQFIFVPLQVVEDSNIYLHSPWIRNMRELYLELEQLSLRDPKLRFVVKPHPACPENYDDLKEMALASKGKICFVEGLPTLSLVTQATAVLTINSTVGMEALMARKRLVVVGQAVYGVESMVGLAGNRSQLNAIFQNLDAWQVDEVLVNQYLCFLKNEYAVAGDAMQSPGAQHWQAMVSKLQQMMSGDVYNAIGLTPPAAIADKL